MLINVRLISVVNGLHCNRTWSLYSLRQFENLYKIWRAFIQALYFPDCHFSPWRWRQHVSETSASIYKSTQRQNED